MKLSRGLSVFTAAKPGSTTPRDQAPLAIEHNRAMVWHEGNATIGCSLTAMVFLREGMVGRESNAGNSLLTIPC